MASANKVDLIITMSGSRPIHEVARDLRAAGFEVGQVLEVIGSVTGSADPQIRKKLAAISGVAHVGDDYEVTTASPEDPLP